MTRTRRRGPGAGLESMAQSLLLVLIGGILIVLYTSGRYLWYIKSSSGLLLVAGGGVLTIIGAIGVVLTARQRARQLRAAHEGIPVVATPPADDGHGERSAIGWLLLIPILVLVIAPPALGADSVARTSTVATVAQQPSVSESSETAAASVDGTRMTMIGFIRHTVYDSDKSVRQDRVTVTGFIAPAGPDFPHGYFIARLLITCCAADAQSVRIFVPGPAPYPPDTWVDAVVTAEPGTAAANAKDGLGYTPVAAVHAITSTGQPVDPYEQ